MPAQYPRTSFGLNCSTPSAYNDTFTGQPITLPFGKVEGAGSEFIGSSPHLKREHIADPTKDFRMATTPKSKFSTKYNNRKKAMQA